MITQRMMVRGVKTVPDVWEITINTEATAQGEKKTGIPFNLYGQDGVKLTVDWGDGNTSILTRADYTELDSSASVHEYSVAGIYTIEISSKSWQICNILSAHDFASSGDLPAINNAIVSLYWYQRTLVGVGALPKVFGVNYYDSNSAPTTLDSRPQSLSRIFERCTKLSNIEHLLFRKNSSVEKYWGVFEGCTSIVSVPDDIFYGTSGIEFEECFRGCSSLLSISSLIFKDNVDATNFDSCFRDCTSLVSIPSGLFDNNGKALSFNGCFRGCTSITAIPDGLFSSNTLATNFGTCFRGCSALTSIPVGLFEHNIAATTFISCFYNCVSIAAIPTQLFRYNVSAIDFSFCFYLCSSLTEIPIGLFDQNTAAQTFRACFAECLSLSVIPEDLFEYNIAITTLQECFRMNTTNQLGDLSLRIGSALVNNVTNFVVQKTGATRTIYVPSGSTTETTFNAVASNLGLTIIGE